MIALTHGRVTLALHELHGGDGRPLLLLHGLGLATPSTVPDDIAGWTGPVYGLDFTGHGRSTIPAGGGYTAEVLMGDVDAAIDHLGAVTLLGRGLGAYVALLIAGPRADAVHGAILADGPGIAGGGATPGTPQPIYIPRDAPSPPDPYAIAELSRDLRPSDYAQSFARLAIEASTLPTPVAVVAKARPDWLRAVTEEPGVIVCPLDDALRAFA